MIGFLSGFVAAQDDAGCLIDVGGVGYRVECSAETLRRLPLNGEPCRVWTHLHVRDDALMLFGFATEAERGVFEALIGVAGVGPKVAQALCSHLPVEEFKRALVAEDTEAIAAVPGIGKKTAGRIVIDLKERLGGDEIVLERAGDVKTAARSALENLGYTPQEARAALAELDATDDVEGLVRSALKVLA